MYIGPIKKCAQTYNQIPHIRLNTFLYSFIIANTVIYYLNLLYENYKQSIRQYILLKYTTD